MTAHDLTISRRAMLQGMGGLVIALHLPLGVPKAAAAGDAAASFAPNAFVSVGTDDTVTVLVKHIEFGQGPFTGLATLVAEEMDADWSQVRPVHAPSNPELYNNLAFGDEFKVQGTGGSSAIANSYEQMRKAGATARALLVAAAARAWDVPGEEITVAAGVIRHAASGNEGRFGEFAEAAAGLPVPDDVTLKPESAFTLIGRDNRATPRPDGADKARGRAMFTMDIVGPDLLTVVVAHPPRFGATVEGFDAAAALAVRDVVDVKQIGTGVAVYAHGTWPAIKARDLLEIEWDESAAETRSSEEMVAEYRELARTPGKEAGAHGDADGALAGAEQVLETEFVFPYLAHAPMEPLDGVLEWDGTHARARYGSQLQTVDHNTIAAVLGIEPANVSIETMLAGGSFGRRAQQSAHFAAELAMAAAAIGPGHTVKLVWTREDDVTGGYYRPLTVHRLRAGLAGGRIAGWANTIVTQSILTGSPFEGLVVNGIDMTSVEGAREIPYDIPDFRCDLHDGASAVPVLWWRSVGHTHTGYAVECFMDELLQALGQDPVEGRLALMGNAPRHAGVLRAVADLAQWSGPGPDGDRARGVAVVESFGSFVAQIAEVSAGEDGSPRVHKVWCAIDCGVAVNPDVIRAQMEGGIGFGLGHMLHGEVALDGGRPVQTNFDTYRSLTIGEMPDVEVVIVSSQEAPSGVGEPGVPPIAPAVANAMARLGLGRPRRLPVVREAV
jgi:isoquinoline 1-oxidoreductase beta subunit